MNTIAVTANAMGIAITVILLGSCCLEYTRKDRIKAGFANLTIMVFLTMLVELIYWLMYRVPEVQNVLALFSTAAGVILAAAFYGFFYIMIRERTEISARYIHADMILMGGAVIFHIISFLQGNLFTVKDGILQLGDMYAVNYALNFLPTVLAFITAIRYRSCMRIRELLSLLLFATIPLIATTVESITPKVSLTYPSCSLVLLALYVLLEIQQEDTSAMRQQAILEASRKDVLTGLQNRLAYEETLKLIRFGTANTAVFFTDMNGLKHVNDTLGHTAGDLYLKSYADLLRQVFRETDLFRISGDEFVILLDGVSEELALRKKEMLGKAIAEHNNISAAGYAFGSGQDIDTLLKQAETQMYVVKEQYHRNNRKEIQR